MSIFLGTVLCASARAQEGNAERVTVTWTDPTRPGLLKVNILGGSITIRTHPGNDVIIEGTPGRDRRPVPAEAAGLRRLYSNTAGLNVEEENNVMSVSTGWSVGVHLDIQVPAKTNLNVKTLNGTNIVIDDVEGEIEATNLNGAVTLNNVAGSIVAHSMNGKVTASLRQATADKPMAFTSMNGAVDITLPLTLKANLKMRTENGEVFSDFDIQLSPRNRAPSFSRFGGPGPNPIEFGRTLTGTINGGGPDFNLRTFSGNIYLRKAKQ